MCVQRQGVRGDENRDRRDRPVQLGLRRRPDPDRRARARRAARHCRPEQRGGAHAAGHRDAGREPLAALYPTGERNYARVDAGTRPRRAPPARSRSSGSGRARSTCCATALRHPDVDVVPARRGVAGREGRGGWRMAAGQALRTRRSHERWARSSPGAVYVAGCSTRAAAKVIADVRRALGPRVPRARGRRAAADRAAVRCRRAGRARRARELPGPHHRRAAAGRGATSSRSSGPPSPAGAWTRPRPYAAEATRLMLDAIALLGRVARLGDEGAAGRARERAASSGASASTRTATPRPCRSRSCERCAAAGATL